MKIFQTASSGMLGETETTLGEGRSDGHRLTDKTKLSGTRSSIKLRNAWVARIRIRIELIILIIVQVR